MYQYLATITRVVDGDTVHANLDLGLDVRINVTLRLYGVNAPERGTPEGKTASEWLTQKLCGKVAKITTFKDRREKYGRYLATIELSGEEYSVNEQLKQLGYAVAYFGA